MVLGENITGRGVLTSLHVKDMAVLNTATKTYESYLSFSLFVHIKQISIPETPSGQMSVRQLEINQFKYQSWTGLSATDCIFVNKRRCSANVCDPKSVFEVFSSQRFLKTHLHPTVANWAMPLGGIFV